MEANGASSATYKQKITYLWNVEGINEHDFKPGEHVNSSRIFTDDTVLKSDWKLRLYPSGYDSDSKDKLILALMKTSSYGKEEQIESCTFSILNSDKEKSPDIHFLKLNNPIKDLNKILSQIYSLDKKKLRFQKFIHGDTLSLMCEIYASKKLDDKKQKAIVLQELRMWSTTSIIKPCSSTISASVNETEQTAILLYGQSFVQIKYKTINDGTYSFELVKHPEINYIWCQIQLNYTKTPNTSHSRNNYACAINENYSQYEWNGKLESSLFVTLPGIFIADSANRTDNGFATRTVDVFATRTVNGFPTRKINHFTMSTTFLAITPKESFVCDFITAKQEMQQNYTHLLTQPTFGDVSIQVGERTLRAHKDILTARSAVFAAMFASNMLEASTKTVIVTDFQFKTIHALLKHIYYGMTEVSGVDIVELFKAAVKYNLGVLQRDCEKLLCDHIDVDNVMNLMILTNMYNAPMLKNSLLSFMKNVPHMQIN